MLNISKQILYIYIAIIFLLTGCSKQGTIEIIRPDNLGCWIGQYEFNECTNVARILILYDINIYKEDENYFADIYIDGFKITQRLTAKVNGDENAIDLAFEKYLPDNISTPYEEGDLLLKLSKEGENILTEWGKIKAIDEYSQDSNKIYFTKLQDDEAELFNPSINQHELASSQEELSSWIYQYVFDEAVPTHYAWAYDINIYKRNNKYYAFINVDGFQTSKKIIAKVEGNKDSIDFVFERYSLNNVVVCEPFKKGDILLSFTKKGSYIYTKWGEISAMVSENQESNKICFTKYKD